MKPMTVDQLIEVLEKFPKNYLVLLAVAGEYLPIKSIASRAVVEADDDLFIDYDETDELHEHMQQHAAISISDEEDQD
jgi:hypothetical protein